MENNVTAIMKASIHHTRLASLSSEKNDQSRMATYNRKLAV